MTHLSAVTGCGCLVVLSACTVTRQGTLMRLPRGPTVPVTVSIQEESATVRGTNPETGEKLEGTLRLEKQNRRGDRGMLGPAPVIGGEKASPGMPPPPVTGRKATLDMAGLLEGDKGTNLKCVVQIEKRIRIRGSGTCRPVEGDDLNPTYRLRF